MRVVPWDVGSFASEEQGENSIRPAKHETAGRSKRKVEINGKIKYKVENGKEVKESTVQSSPIRTSEMELGLADARLAHNCSAAALT